MSEPRAEKECRFCRERIDARARRCPHCRMQQTRWAILLHPGLILAGFLVIVAMFGWMIADMSASFAFGRGAPVARPPGLVVTDTHLGVEEGAKGPVDVITGTVSNDGETSWEDVSLAAVVTDKADDPVEVLETRVDSLPAGEQRTFRMEGPALLPADRYVHHTVRVVSARKG